MILGAPQGSILEPLLFNIYKYGLFILIKDVDVCNFADDATIFICDYSLQKALNSLGETAELAICWFENSFMKLNTYKCHLLISGFKRDAMWAKIRKDMRWEKSDVKLLGVTWK